MHFHIVTIAVTYRFSSSMFCFAVLKCETVSRQRAPVIIELSRSNNSIILLPLILQ